MFVTFQQVPVEVNRKQTCHNLNAARDYVDQHHNADLHTHTNTPSHFCAVFEAFDLLLWSINAVLSPSLLYHFTLAAARKSNLSLLLFKGEKKQHIQAHHTRALLYCGSGESHSYKYPYISKWNVKCIKRFVTQRRELKIVALKLV